MNPNLSYSNNAEDELDHNVYEVYAGEEALTWSPACPSSFLGLEHPGSVVHYSYQGQPLGDGAQFDDGAEVYFEAHRLSASWYPADDGMTSTEATFTSHEADGQAPGVPSFYALIDGDLATSIGPLVDDGLEEPYVHREKPRSKQRRCSKEIPRQGTSSQSKIQEVSQRKGTKSGSTDKKDRKSTQPRCEAETRAGSEVAGPGTSILAASSAQEHRQPDHKTGSKARQGPGKLKSSSSSSSSRPDGGGPNHHRKNNVYDGQQPRSGGSAASVPSLTPTSSHPSSIPNADPSSFTTSAVASQAQSQANGNDGDGLNPRVRHRLVTTTKCRAKSKSVRDQLEATARNSETRFVTLTNYVHELKEEVYLLKLELLRHTDCGDSMIQEYIDHSARAIVANKVQATVSEAVNLLEDFVPSTGCGGMPGQHA